MSRGKSRNRYRTNSFQNIGCFETVYDGVDDSFASADAVLKTASPFTWACEAYLESSQPDTYGGLLSNNTSGTDGIALYHQPGVSMIRWETRGTGGGIAEVSHTVGSWIKLVGVYDGTNVKLYKYLSSWVSDSTVASFNTATGDFRIGMVDFAGARDFNGKLKNIEIYTGAATDATTWVPGNTSSMAGTTLVMDAEEGNGTSSQGIPFTKNGDPITQRCT